VYGASGVSGTNPRASVDLRLALVIGFVLLIALGGSVAWAASTNGRLNETRMALAASEAELAATNVNLATTSSQLDASNADIKDEEARITTATSRISSLESLIGRKGECIEVQARDLAELRRILGLQRKNFARTTTTSRWGKALAAGDRAMDIAIVDMKNAYTSAAAGRLSTANIWIDRSNAQIRASNRQVDIANREIDRMNELSDVINAARDAFTKQLDRSAEACS
jgi:hypothetical protein